MRIVVLTMLVLLVGASSAAASKNMAGVYEGEVLTESILNPQQRGCMLKDLNVIQLTELLLWVNVCIMPPRVDPTTAVEKLESH